MSVIVNHSVFHVLPIIFKTVLKDTSHPGHSLFELLPSGKDKQTLNAARKENNVHNIDVSYCC